MIFSFDYLLEYTRPKVFLLLSKLSSTFINQLIIDLKLAQDLIKRIVVEIIKSILTFISLALGFVSKHDGSLQKIHQFFYSKGSSINSNIVNKAFDFSYTSLQKIFDKFLVADRYIVLIK